MTHRTPARLSPRAVALAVALAVGTVAAPSALAQVDPLSDDAADVRGGPAWNDLTPGQRQALAPLQREWPSVGAQRKRKWMEIADRFPSMPAAEQQRVQQRMTDWARMTPEERGRARSTFRDTRQLPAEERQARWKAYQSLSEDERRALASGARAPGADADARGPDERQDGARKSNIVGERDLPRGNPGATTRAPLEPASPPPHQQAGLPKITATPEFVDRSTLLPQRGPQGAAPRPARPASGPRGERGDRGDRGER